MRDLDFAWPAGLIGRSSGWSDRKSPAETMAHPPVGARRDVGLTPRWRGLRIGVDADGALDVPGSRPTPILVKVSKDTAPLKGLSSGASSALVREADGRVVRIKRCGFAQLGIGPRVGFVGRIGMMSIAEAIQECRMLATFRAQGLCPACEPLSLDLLTDPAAPFFAEHASAVVHVAVTSDVRADEWFLHILQRELEAAGVEPPVLVVRDDERVVLRQPAAALAALRQIRPFERVARLGRGLGGLLRAAHDAGLLRGRGSVWMGNDVVGPDLRLSAIDCDGGAMRTGGATAAMMQRIEAVEYAAGFADCFSWGQPDWLAEITTVLTEAYWEGYRRAASPDASGSAPP